MKGGDITYHSSTAGNHLEPNKKHNVSIRESSEDYSWYCQVPLDVGAVDAGLQPGWEVRPTVVINSEPEATVKEFAISGACKFGIFGRVLGTDAARLTNLDITNTPAGDIGYNLGGTVQVTATFSKPVTGTFSMAINIGDRVAVAEATGVNNNTVIFEFTILETDSDDNGINFDENALHGYADADLGHNNLEADVNNRIVTASQGPIGRAAIGGVLTANPLSEFATSRGETHTGHTYQWLRDGEEIPGATGDTYTLIGADSGKRMSTRVSYMVGGSARSVNSNATPYVAGESIMLVGNTERNPSSGWPNPGDSAVQWVSFIAGTNPNGYLLDRMRVMYHEHTDFAAEFPISEYKAAIELARNDGVPMADSEIAELLVEGPIRRGESGYFQAPPVIHLDRNTRYNLALREYNTGHSSCKTANQDQYNANGRQPGWKIRSRVEGHTDPDSMVTEHNFLRPCASEFHGHVINPDAVAYLTALGIVNTPEDGDGFESGDIVEVTAVLSEAITGTFSMSINIGRRTATATATGVDTDTFVFSYTISGSDDDIDGITFDEHSIQFNGWLALDLGHNDLWPIAENKVVPFILGDGPMGKAVEGETLTIGDLSELATFLGETPTSYSYQWLRDGVVIPGETGNTYTLIDADSGYRISVLTTYTLADSSTGEVNSPATSRVVSNSTAFIRTLSQDGYGERTFSSEAIWMGFRAGTNPNGYTIDRTVVKFHGGNTYAPNIEPRHYKISLGKAGGNAFNNYHPRSTTVFQFYSEDTITSRVVSNRKDGYGERTFSSEAIWMGFRAGTNPNGYTIDRTVVKFHGGNTYAPNIEPRHYKISLGNAFNNYHPRSTTVFQFYSEDTIRKGEDSTFQAPPVAHVERGWYYNIVLRETHPANWSCVFFSGSNVDPQRQPGWVIHSNTAFSSNPNAGSPSSSTNGHRCRFGIFGRVINTDAPRLTSLGITNAPNDDSGFNIGDMVEVTAKFNKPVTGTLTMSINIGTRVAVTTSTGTDINTFVFEYEILEADVDLDGITFENNAIHGYVDADLGHNNSWPVMKNGIALTPLPGPMGRAVVGQEITIGSLTGLITQLGETPTYSYQWLRDGVEISGATGEAYTLINDDVGKRVNVRITFTLANANIGRVESVATSRVVGRNGAFIRNNDLPGNNHLSGGYGAMWLGFKTGNSANGYMLDEAKIRFSGNGEYAVTIPKNQYSVHLEGTGTGSGGYRPKDIPKFQFHENSDVTRNQEITVQAPTVAYMERDKKYNISMRETHSGAWSCQATTYRNFNEQQSGWDMRFGISAAPDPTAETHERDTGSNRCKFGVFGRAIVSSNYLTSLGITNTPPDGNGFDSEDIIEVTAVLTESITGTLTMSLDIGGRIVTATAEGDNTNTFVFEFVTTNTDADVDGVTFGDNVLHGYVDADLGHTDLWPNRKNGVNVPPMITDIRETSAPDDPAVGYTTGEEMDLTFTFDKPIEVIGTGIRLTMTFHGGRVDPTNCATSDWRPSMRYDAAKSTSTTMVFSAAVIDDIHDQEAWVNNNDIQLHGGTVTDGWRPAGSKINADLGYHRGGTGINYPFNVDSRTACNN